MENEERCPNCDMPLEDPEVCNYCNWTRNKLLEETSRDKPEKQESAKR